MTRARLVVLLALLALAARAAVAEDPPAPPPAPVSDAEWDARDGEARWVLFRASPASEDAWIAYATHRKDWAFLEKLSLAARSGNALAALARARAPGWARCARWALRARDSHKRSLAERLLDEAREPREATDAWDPEALLAPLVPPADLADLGDALRAEPGRTYVHQVERAIDVLAETTLRGEPWDGRLAALIVHRDARVRRAACLSYGGRLPEDVAFEALLARVHDAAETPEVRAAAALGLSWGPEPAAYAALLSLSSAPAHPAWRAAVSRLGDVDDGFAPTVWKDLDLAPAGEGAAAFLDEQTARIAERDRSRDAPARAERVGALLERAAWADLGCEPHEGRLVAWTSDRLRSRAGEPEVRAALERARDAYEPAPTAGGRRDALRARVRDYARSALEGAPARAR